MFSDFCKPELDFCTLVKPVADLLKVPKDETQVVFIIDAGAWVDIRD